MNGAPLPAGPLTSREALTFEQLAGCSVLEALDQQHRGVLSASACVAALVVAHQRLQPTVGHDEVLDGYSEFSQLLEFGSDVLTALTSDGGDEAADDGS